LGAKKLKGQWDESVVGIPSNNCARYIMLGAKTGFAEQQN